MSSHMGCLLLSSTVVYRWLSQSNELMTLLETKQLCKKDQEPRTGDSTHGRHARRSFHKGGECLMNRMVAS